MNCSVRQRYLSPNSLTLYNLALASSHGIIRWCRTRDILFSGKEEEV